MKRVFVLFFLVSLVSSLKSQSVINLDSCRTLALSNNKELLIAKEKIQAAHYQRKAAFTNYLPNFSAVATYMRNQKEISLLNNEQKSGLTNMGTNASNQVEGAIKQLGTINPELAQKLGTLFGSFDLASPLNGIGSSIADAFRTDTRNVYAGAIMMTQPIYMGGKIRAYNKITRYAEELAESQQNSGLQEVILNTDQAYWQVVSLANKKKLAESYLQLLNKLDNDVEKMIAEGIATKADGLSIKVKVNEAEMTLTKVEDGLSLSRMLLCQLCGLDLTTPIVLADENLEDLNDTPTEIPANLPSALNSRPELKSLELATQIYRQKVNITRSEHLPSVALMGNYLVTNPSLYNGFENKFGGMWNVGIMLKLPLWHWGEGLYKTKAAKAEARISEYQLADAREKIELQANQSAFKVNEAAKKLIMSEKNMEKANENLRYANLGFEEGVIPPSNVLEAHTAWLSAHSDKIDAQIDVKLTKVYLERALGTLRK